MGPYMRYLREVGRVAEMKPWEDWFPLQTHLEVTHSGSPTDFFVRNRGTGEEMYVDTIGRVPNDHLHMLQSGYSLRRRLLGDEDENDIWTANYRRLKKRKKFARERNIRIVYCFIDVTDEDGHLYVDDHAFHEFVDIMDLTLGRKVVRKEVRAGSEFVVIERNSLYPAKRFGLSEGEYLWQPPLHALQ